MGVGVPPKGKYMFGMVKVGDKGQIVIPAKARKIFNIKPGDNLVILGDENAGLAILKEEDLLAMMQPAKQTDGFQVVILIGIAMKIVI